MICFIAFQFSHKVGHTCSEGNITHTTRTNIIRVFVLALSLHIIWHDLLVVFFNCFRISTLRLRSQYNVLRNAMKRSSEICLLLGAEKRRDWPKYETCFFSTMRVCEQILMLHKRILKFIHLDNGLLEFLKIRQCIFHFIDSKFPYFFDWIEAITLKHNSVIPNCFC